MNFPSTSSQCESLLVVDLLMRQKTPKEMRLFNGASIWGADYYKWNNF